MPSSNILKTSLADQLAQLSPAWREPLEAPEPQRALAALEDYLAARRRSGAVIYPDRPFRALELVQPEAVRVVILGQDPYHGPGQAQGLAFSVPEGVRRPPSLRNIFLEVSAEQGHPEPAEAARDSAQGSLALEAPEDASALARLAVAEEAVQERAEHASNDLTRWARQGVLLLNTSLTVEDGKAGSHAKRGWETVTDTLIAHVAAMPEPKVFMLWGAHAQAKRALLPDSGGHLVLSANHPSPLSARRPPVPFLGCGHFRRANVWLIEQGRKPIDWLSD